MERPALRFGRFALRPATRELCAEGKALRVGERAFDLLPALVEAGGRSVSRDALFVRAWPGRVVLDDNLKVQVMALRRLLGREAVVTVPGLGYRFGLKVARQRALAAIARAAGAQRLAAWQAEGERWNDDDAARALLS